MSTVAQLVHETDAATLTTHFLECAAALEAKLHDTEQQVHALRRRQQLADVRLEQTRRGLKAIRRSHSRDSHFKTTKLIKRLYLDLAMPLGLQLT